MAAIRRMLRDRRDARWFFAAHAQASIGTGAGYVALLVVAYERLRSPWAVALVLLADYLPGTVLGPVLGALGDRFSRKWCVVVAEALRAGAFLGLAFVSGFAATLALALVAGLGGALYYPSVLSGLPSVVGAGRAPEANALFSALRNFGDTGGPLLAAGAIVLVGPDPLLAVNGVTFALSAWVMARVKWGRCDQAAPERGALLQETARGIRATLTTPGVLVLIAVSFAVVMFSAMMNVAELVLVQRDLGGGSAGFALLVAVFGVGVVGGSLASAGGGDLIRLRRGFLAGVAVCGAGMVASSLTPSVGVACATFLVTGIGAGLVLVHQRILVHALIAESMLARAFGVLDSVTSWAYAIA
jgi:MFS family permease